MTKEAKSERFVRLAEARVNKIIKMVRLLGNLSWSSNYEYTTDQVAQIFKALQTELNTARQRFAGVGKANTVHVVVRNDRLQDTTFQTKIKPTLLCGDVAKTAFELFCRHIPTGTKVRMLGVSVSGFDYNVEQLSFESVLDGGGREKKERAEDAVAKIREKYGYASLQRGLVMEDERLNGLDIRGKKETENE